MRIGRAFLTVLFVSAGAALIPREAAAQGHGVITGRIVDERGNPVVNATVVAWAPDMSGGYRRSSHAAEARSDDRGIYRLHSLRSRRYVVCVVQGVQPPPLDEAQSLQYDIDRVREIAELTTGPRSDAARERLAQLEARLPTQVDPVRGFAPVCYADANGTRMTFGLAADDERAGVDFRLTRTRLAGIGGSVVGLALATDEDAHFQLVNEDQELGDVRPAVRLSPSRRFLFRDVPPGRYALVMTVQGRVTGPSLSRVLAGMPIVVADADLRGLELTVPKPASVAGRLVLRGRTTPPADGLTQVTIRLTSIEHDALHRNGAWYAAQVDGDGRFTFPEVQPGSYQIAGSFREPTPSWFLDSVSVAGRDVTFDPVDLEAGQTLTDVFVTLTDRRASLAGTAVDEAGRPAARAAVFVYAKDPRSRKPAGYRLAMGYSSHDGDYVVKGLRPGSYRVAARSNVEFGAWFEPGFFDQLDPAATAVSIVGEGQAILDVRVRSSDR
jgi:protocatechuate 3,4-dioxygenase beta subunit